MTIEEMQEWYEKKFRFKSRSLKYKVASLVIGIGLVFFLTSNILFNKEVKNFSTPLGENIILNEYKINLFNRVYNKESGLLRLDFSINNDTNNSSNDNQNNLNFELIEKSDIDKALPIKVEKVNDEDYVLYCNLKKWSAVALKIINKNPIDDYSNSIKIYSDIKDIPINNELKEQDLYTLKIEFVDRDIAEVEKEITEKDNEITLKNEKIKSLEEKINKINEEIKYQVEEEKEKSNNEINISNQEIEKLKVDINNLNNEKETLKNKIEKLNEKKKDIENSMR